MNILNFLLLASKIGLYAPGTNAPFPMWFYGSLNLSVFEVGGTSELVKKKVNFLGLVGTIYEWVPALFIGAHFPISKDLDFSLGMKKGKDASVYAGLSLKLGSVKWTE